MCGTAAAVQPLAVKPLAAASVATSAQKVAASAPGKANDSGASNLSVTIVQLSGEEILVAEVEPNCQVAVLRSFTASALGRSVNSCGLFVNGHELPMNLSVADSGLVDGDIVTALVVSGACHVGISSADVSVVDGPIDLTGIRVSLSHIETRGVSASTVSGQATVTGASGSLKAGEYYFYVEVQGTSPKAVTFFELVNVHGGVSEVLWIAT